MDSLDGVSLPLAEQPTTPSYSLPGSEMEHSTGDLVSLNGPNDADLTEDSTKELPRLIIQERLEEPTNGTEPESVAIQAAFPSEVDDSSIHVMEDGSNVLSLAHENGSPGNAGTINEDDADEGEQSVQQTGYLVYNPTQHTLRLASSEVTPLLVLANNTEKGMYEANVILSQTSAISQIMKLQDQQLNMSPEMGSSSQTSSPAEPTTITMTLDAETQLLLDAQNQGGQLLYVCDMDHCGAAFASLEEFQQHQVYHQCENDPDAHGMNAYNKNLVCRHEGCGRVFSWPTHLKYHELTHTGRRMYKCNEPGCGASFYTVQRLTVHRRIHTGEKPFVCTEPNCGKKFTTQGNLKNHARIHSGEKPFACAVQGCSKRFAEHSSLRKHTLVHTGAKPYMCDLCGKRFSQSGSRNVHMKRHQTMAEESLEKDGVEAHNTSLLVKLQNDKVLVLQQAQDEMLQNYQGFKIRRECTIYWNKKKRKKLDFEDFELANSDPKDLPTSESVVFSNAATDHVVTVTTQPADNEVDSLQPNHISGKRESANGVGHHKDVSIPTPTTGANVVVLSQPEEMVAMAPGYHHEGEDHPKDIVYSCHHLLNVDVS